MFEKIKTNLRNKARAFVLGDQVVTPTMQYWGVDKYDIAPVEYGEYIATSNDVYTCITGRADLLTTLRRKLYKTNARGEQVEVTNGRLHKLLQSVNPHWTFRRLIDMTEKSLGLWGEAFWFLERGENGKGTPREIWWGKPSDVIVYPHPQNYVDHYSFTVDGVELEFSPSEVIWFRYGNPNDEFKPLSPLAAARIYADYTSAALKSNRALFANGSQIGGVFSPKDGVEITPDQGAEIEKQLDQRLRGADKAHKWAFLRFALDVKEMGVSPKDAEFLGGLRWSLESVCRAYKWPQDLVGGQRTYENYSAAMRAAYTHAVLPEADFIAEELTEQLLPMFAGEADLFAFDHSHIDILQEGENERWTREQGQITVGAITVNEWRKGRGLKPVPWGDERYTPPSAFGALPEINNEADSEDEAGRMVRIVEHGKARMVEFGSEEHRRVMARFDDRAARLEKLFSEMAVELFRRQQDSILSRLNERGARAGEDLADEPFDLKKWIKEFRMKSRLVLRVIVDQIAADTYGDLGLSIAFDVDVPLVVRFIERQAQRFAQEVNDTTWKMLRASLAEGIGGGEGIDKLAQRVKEVMAERIRSTPETIARTETNTAANGGTLLAYGQSGVVKAKTWLAAVDGRERESHREAHLRYQAEPIALEDDFVVGNGRGPAPGQIGLPEEDINCRCTMQPVLED